MIFLDIAIVAGELVGIVLSVQMQIPAEQCSHSEISGAVIPMSRFMFSG